MVCCYGTAAMGSCGGCYCCLPVVDWR
jgi:hypothetical protein